MTLRKILKCSLACCLGMSLTLSTISRADDERMPADTGLSLSGKTGSIAVSVKYAGRFDLPGWKSSITIAKKNQEDRPIYQDQSTHALQMVKLLPTSTKVRSIQGSDVFMVGYLLVVDGLDADEWVLVMIHHDKVYKSTSQVLKQLEEDQKTDPLKIDSTMPPALQKIAKEQWSEFLRTWDK